MPAWVVVVGSIVWWWVVVPGLLVAIGIALARRHRERETRRRKAARDAGSPSAAASWVFERKSAVPNWIKNQPPFIHCMADAVQHGRVHGPYTVDGVKLPRFNFAQRFLQGTPDWWKAFLASSAGHTATAVQRQSAGPPTLNSKP